MQFRTPSIPSLHWKPGNKPRLLVCERKVSKAKSPQRKVACTAAPFCDVSFALEPSALPWTKITGYSVISGLNDRDERLAHAAAMCCCKPYPSFSISSRSMRPLCTIGSALHRDQSAEDHAATYLSIRH